MSIDEATVARIAHLARLKVPDADRKKIAGELSKIIDWVAELDAVDVANVEPLFSVNDSSLRTRDDVVTDGAKVQDILANAPAKTADFFTVPKVIE
jgi:aspartyl-tRNA(Asn)/glutamyl-tRNA(Gln) amidotransferase subunit C